MGRQPSGSPGQTDPLAAAAHAWAQRTCQAQGLDAQVSDPRVLGQVAALLVGSPLVADVRGLDAPDSGQA